jgi:phosphoribosylglycinamide formyltransferase-1
MDVLTRVDPYLIVLAGWMRVLSAGFLERCRCPMLNVHPALLPMEGSPLDVPVLRGAHAVRDALELGLPYTGVSVHEVTAEVDAGPVVRREVVPILANDDEHSLYGRIKAVEHRLLIEAITTVLVTNVYGGVHA